MKIKLIAAIISIVVFSVSVAFAKPGAMTLKTGDTAYICGCGDKCACGTVSLKSGKCNCGHDMAKVSISRVQGKKAFYEADGKEKAIKLAGKYACDCGGDCCQMISQKPGKCTCGKELAKVDSKKK